MVACYPGRRSARNLCACRSTVSAGLNFRIAHAVASACSSLRVRCHGAPCAIFNCMGCRDAQTSSREQSCRRVRASVASAQGASRCAFSRLDTARQPAPRGVGSISLGKCKRYRDGLGVQGAPVIVGSEAHGRLRGRNASPHRGAGNLQVVTPGSERALREGVRHA